MPNPTQHGRWNTLHPAHQSDHVKVGTVVALGVNWFAHCSSPVLVFLCANDSGDADGQGLDISDNEDNC